MEKTKENKKTKKIFFSAKGPTVKIANPKNNDKNNGIRIRAKGIRFSKVWSWVKDIVIQ